jgi:hypothetical protein
MPAPSGVGCSDLLGINPPRPKVVTNYRDSDTHRNKDGSDQNPSRKSDELSLPHEKLGILNSRDANLSSKGMKRARALVRPNRHEQGTERRNR